MKISSENTQELARADLVEAARHAIPSDELAHCTGAMNNGSSTAFNALLAELYDESSQAYIDDLTGVANRRVFVDHAKSALRATKRRGGVMALMYLNIDDFSVINDTRGRDAGDALLCEIAKRLQQSVREVDCVARIGGDEFTVVLQEVGSRAFVERLIMRIFGTLAEPLLLADGTEWEPRCSVGVVLSDGLEELKHLMSRADRTMYAIKHSGKNQFLVRDLFDDA